MLFVNVSSKWMSISHFLKTGKSEIIEENQIG